MLINLFCIMRNAMAMVLRYQSLIQSLGAVKDTLPYNQTERERLF